MKSFRQNANEDTAIIVSKFYCCHCFIKDTIFSKRLRGNSPIITLRILRTTSQLSSHSSSITEMLSSSFSCVRGYSRTDNMIFFSSSSAHQSRTQPPSAEDTKNLALSHQIDIGTGCLTDIAESLDNGIM